MLSTFEKNNKKKNKKQKKNNKKTTTKHPFGLIIIWKISFLQYIFR